MLWGAEKYWCLSNTGALTVRMTFICTCPNCNCELTYWIGFFLNPRFTHWLIFFLQWVCACSSCSQNNCHDKTLSFNKWGGITSSSCNSRLNWILWCDNEMPTHPCSKLTQSSCKNVTLNHKTKSCTAQFCAMAKNMWSGSACVIFRFRYILKEQFFFYIILKFGSIKCIISSCSCCFSKPMFFSLIVFAIVACVLSLPYNHDYLAHFESQQLLNGAS